MGLIELLIDFLDAGLMWLAFLPHGLVAQSAAERRCETKSGCVGYVVGTVEIVVMNGRHRTRAKSKATMSAQANSSRYKSAEDKPW